ncbi:helix-turn-helix domain-containing protein [Paremcibacter congregatus]|uniref:Transcriptional regulator n=1 Tax=Paremcibacter congregatus TaxID=2043170 RepID=A0A2G4YVV2_9PROT|nr:transcriptional regulator [Paremcibacter congregatus]PHZ86457.1 transcriptional regulator [Paremcibacter congregatus]QDE28446.1 transcriptional regulator [Paremcibacter congregatus]|tara:strand:- start:413 stop:664 length:252 start_codon:yes stop_codon:yes gene_type:complete
MKTGHLTSAQIRAARAMLRWEQAVLTEKSGVSLATIKRLEKMTGKISANLVTLQAIERAFTEAGIEFLPDEGRGAGVRLGLQK